MEPASTRVFGLPELASIIASYFDKKDLTRLMLTSCRMHTTIEPWFYRDLRTYSDYSNNSPKGLNINLCDSPDGLRALSRNIQFVKTWETDLFNLVFISHATVAIQLYLGCDNNGNANNRNGNDKELDVLPRRLLMLLTWTKEFPARTRRPLISTTTTRDLLRLIPLPPVMSLSRLSLRLPLHSIDTNHDDTLPSGKSTRTTTIHLCENLQRLPQLRELALENLSVRDSRRIQLFTSTLLGMINLRRLQLEVVQHDDTYPGAGLLLLFSCPPSIEKVMIEFVEYEADHYETGSLAKNPFLDTEDGVIDPDDAGAFQTMEEAPDSLSRGPINRPLTNLRELHLESCMSDAALEQVMSDFESCPSLETLYLSELDLPGGLNGADVGRMCPNLRRLQFDGIVETNGDKLWPLGIMETLPRNRMESWSFNGGGGLQQSVDVIVAGKALLRHSGSLREFHACSRTASAAMGLILETCEVLEVLVCYYSSVDLNDAVASPWASSKMTRLTMNVTIPMLSPSSLSNTQTQYTACYLQTPPVPPSEDENCLFAQLDVFFRPIGKQENLKYLTLNRVTRSEHGLLTFENDWRQASLPGMLRLGGGTDNSTNSNSDSTYGGKDRPGFLHLLGGLSKLEVIKGDAVRPETKDGKMFVNVMEVDWIRTHWPLLREMSFSFASKGSEEDLRYL